jgi:hypothetical protein
MSFSMARLLMDSGDVPPEARAELRAAQAATLDRRDHHLTRAARVLHQELGLECADARELAGLPPGAC